jgi:hypothetical protein
MEVGQHSNIFRMIPTNLRTVRNILFLRAKDVILERRKSSDDRIAILLT